MSFRLFVSLLALSLCSCASVSVRKTERLTEKAPVRVPEKIFVRPFEFYEPALRVDRSGEGLEWLKNDLREKFTRHLVRRLKRHIAPAAAVAATAPLPTGNYWLIEGRFDRVNQGSRMLRSVVGFGFGGTKLETSIVVSDLSGKKPRPFLLIQTTGGSNASPGAIGTVGYFASGVTALGSAGNLVEGVRSGLTFDTIRTTKEATAAVSEYLSRQGAIPQKKALGPKRIGTLPRDWWWPFKPQVERSGTITVSPAETPR
jgi:hypothetical protein